MGQIFCLSNILGHFSLLRVTTRSKVIWDIITEHPIFYPIKVRWWWFYLQFKFFLDKLKIFREFSHHLNWTSLRQGTTDICPKTMFLLAQFFLLVPTTNLGHPPLCLRHSLIYIFFKLTVAIPSILSIYLVGGLYGYTVVPTLVPRRSLLLLQKVPNWYQITVLLFESLVFLLIR